MITKNKGVMVYGEAVGWGRREVGVGEAGRYGGVGGEGGRGGGGRRGEERMDWANGYGTSEVLGNHLS